MQIRRLAGTLSVAPQLEVADVAVLAARGFRAIINNRPDGEDGIQPPGAALEAAARQHGLGYRYIPVLPGQVQDASVDAFAEALRQLPGPILAFCRSGTRSAMLWALGAVRERDVDGVLQVAAEAGYDISALRPRLQQAHAAKNLRDASSRS